MKNEPNKLGELLRLIYNCLFSQNMSQESFLPDFFNKITDDSFDSKKHSSLSEKAKINDYLNERRKLTKTISMDLYRALEPEKLHEVLCTQMYNHKSQLAQLSDKLRGDFNYPDNRPKLNSKDLAMFVCSIFQSILFKHIQKIYN